MRTACLALMLLTLAGCRDHVLDDGTYTFTPGAVLRDDCGLAGTPLLGAGTLRTHGHRVELAFDQPELTLTGSYQYNVEAFFLDGSLVNAAATLGGRACALDTVTFHAEGTTTSDTAFTGTMSVHYDSRQADACVCRYWFEFSAAQP